MTRINRNREQADDWPVMFTVFLQDRAGKWTERGTREPVTTVTVDVGAAELLMIRDPRQPVLTVSGLVSQLSALLADYRDFDVDSCETPIEAPDGGSVRLDFPVMAVGRDEAQHCFLLVYMMWAP